MAKIDVVEVLVADGERLVDALASQGIDVVASFWGKPAGSESWYLHVASPYVDQHGSRETYAEINDTLRQEGIQWIDPLQIKVLGATDSLTKAAMSTLMARIPSGPFAVPNPKPYPGMTVLDDCTLGGYEFDEVLIYPPRPTQVSP